MQPSKLKWASVDERDNRGRFLHRIINIKTPFLKIKGKYKRCLFWTGQTTARPPCQSRCWCLQKWKWHQVKMMWLSWWWRWDESRTLTRRWTWIRRLSQTSLDNPRDRWNRSRRMDRHCCTSRYWCKADQSILEPSYSGTALKYTITGTRVNSCIRISQM